jgi:hypothetical protein
MTHASACAANSQKSVVKGADVTRAMETIGAFDLTIANIVDVGIGTMVGLPRACMMMREQFRIDEALLAMIYRNQKHAVGPEGEDANRKNFSLNVVEVVVAVGLADFVTAVPLLDEMIWTQCAEAMMSNSRVEDGSVNVRLGLLVAVTQTLPKKCSLQVISKTPGSCFRIGRQQAISRKNFSRPRRTVTIDARMHLMPQMRLLICSRRESVCLLLMELRTRYSSKELLMT